MIEDERRMSGDRDNCAVQARAIVSDGRASGGSSPAVETHYPLVAIKVPGHVHIRYFLL